MNKFEFIKYESTPDEKHLGIATVNLYGKIIARFKIVPTKDGNSFFPTAPSIKMGEKYVSSLILDSNLEKEELENLIKSHVKNALTGAPISPTQTHNQPTLFDECPF